MKNKILLAGCALLLLKAVDVAVLLLLRHWELF